MFDLDHALRRLARSLDPSCPKGLEEDLRARVEAERARGVDAENAFRHVRDSARAEAQPRSVLGMIARFDARGLGERLDPRARALWLIGISLAFAGAMIVAPREWNTALVALWWIPFTLFAAAGSTGCARRRMA